MKKVKVRLSSIPEDSAINSYLPAGYSDAFVCEAEREEAFNAKEIMLAFWTDKPEWINKLFKLRNILVKPFGLHTGEKTDHHESLKEALETGEPFGINSIPLHTSEETILCMTDKHLTAWISIRVNQSSANHQQIYAITAVKFHNLLGKAYFTAIYPFHHLVVKYALKRIILSFCLRSGGIYSE